jgi:hypothetical protein
MSQVHQSPRWEINPPSPQLGGFKISSESQVPQMGDLGGSYKRENCFIDQNNFNYESSPAGKFNKYLN